MTIPINPPKEWFQPPAEGIPTNKRITITADGRAYGYIALWNTCHVGMGGCVKPPQGSPTNYEYAHQGETLTAEGELIPTAVIAGGAGHAPIDMDTANVPAYYENTGTQLMRVRYGEDHNGLWFAGALWPNVDELQVAQIRASGISGDWRWHAAWRRGTSGMDFMGSCFVNIPGFPMQSDGGITHQPGKPYAIAASSFMPVNDSDDLILLSDLEVEMSGCNGECESCTCGGKEEEPKFVTSEFWTTFEERYGLKPVTASATEEETEEEVSTEPSDIEKLTDIVTSLKDTVDSLVAENLLREIDSVQVDTD